MPYRNGSFYKSLIDRVNTLESTDLGSLPTRIATIENDQSSLQLRTVALETWRANKYNSLADVTVSTSGLSVDVLGVGVMAANSTRTRLEQYGQKINDILAALRQKEIISA